MHGIVTSAALAALLCGSGSSRALSQCPKEGACAPVPLEYKAVMYVPFFLLQQKCTAMDAAHAAQYAQALAKLFPQQQEVQAVQQAMQHDPKIIAYVRDMSAKLEERSAQELQKDCDRLLNPPAKPKQ